MKRLKTKSYIFLSLWLVISLCSCHQNAIQLEPKVFYIPQERHLKSLPEEFDKLTTDELRTEWGREIRIGNTFTKEMDLYRAITSYKRALVMIPSDEIQRRWYAEYGIVLCYYLGSHYQDAAEYFENSTLPEVPVTFPGFRNLLLILHDSYIKIHDCGRAKVMMTLLEEYDEGDAQNVKLSTAISQGDLACIRSLSQNPDVDMFVNQYCQCAKSVRKAQTLNAVLPGAGYYYVGQKKAAFTSLALNTLFTAAAIKFFNDRNIAAGIITVSFEAGWYIGGINGAGLAAKEYNEFLYNTYARETMIKNKLFPVLMFTHVF